MVRLDVEVYNTQNEWVQAKYLVHGKDDVFWTDDLEEALAILRTQLTILNEQEQGGHIIGKSLELSKDLDIVDAKRIIINVLKSCDGLTKENAKTEAA